MKELPCFTYLWKDFPIVLQKKKKEKPLTWRVKPFEVQKLIDKLEELQPGKGRIMVLAILYCLSDRKKYIPTINSAQRLVRNDYIFWKWRTGTSYHILTQENKLSECRIRVIINNILHQRKTRNQ